MLQQSAQYNKVHSGRPLSVNWKYLYWRKVQQMLSMSFKKIRIAKFKPPLKKDTRELFSLRENIKGRMNILKPADLDDYNNLRTELNAVDDDKTPMRTEFEIEKSNQSLEPSMILKCTCII